LRPVFAASCAQHVSDLCSKSTLRPHVVDIQSPTVEIRQGEKDRRKKKKKPQDENIYGP